MSKQERTGGKIIHSIGGVIYLFRGRNYNYRTRPRFPLMLWKPASPVYPRLIKSIPPGLTQDEAIEMRRKGRELLPICKLGKNGIYSGLVKKVQEAFQEFDLVKINCQGMNPSDYRKIGAKLQDLVPCVLISFANEHILIWKGREPGPPLPSLKDYLQENNQPDVDDFTMGEQGAEPIKVPSSASTASPVSENAVDHQSLNEITGNGAAGIEMQSRIGDKDVSLGVLSEDESEVLSEDESEVSFDASVEGMDVSELTRSEGGNEVGTDASIMDSVSNDVWSEDDQEIDFDANIKDEVAVDVLLEDDNEADIGASIIDWGVSEDIRSGDENRTDLGTSIRDGDISEVARSEDENEMPSELNIRHGDLSEVARLEDVDEGSISENASIEPKTAEFGRLGILKSLKHDGTPTSSTRPCTEKLLLLLKKAVEDGAALVLEESTADADAVFQRAVALSRRAPPNPMFMPRRKKAADQVMEPSDEKDLLLDIPRDNKLNPETTIPPATNCSRNRQPQQGKKQHRRRERDEVGSSLGRISRGSLRIDELAKLLA